MKKGARLVFIVVSTMVERMSDKECRERRALDSL